MLSELRRRATGGWGRELAEGVVGGATCSTYFWREDPRFWRENGFEDNMAGISGGVSKKIARETQPSPFTLLHRATMMSEQKQIISRYYLLPSPSADVH